MPDMREQVLEPMNNVARPRSYIAADGRWRHTMRSSWFSKFGMCPEQAAADYFGEVPDRHTDATARGTAVHAAIEYALVEKRDAETPKRYLVVDALDHALNMLWPWDTVKNDRKTVRRHANIMINEWYDNVLPHVNAIKVEEAFEIPFVMDDKREITLTGHIDCIDGDYICWDWKTASRPYELWEQQRWNAQSTAYSFGAWYLLSDRLDPHMDNQYFRFCVLLDNGTHQYVDVKRNHSHVAWLAHQATTIAMLIERAVRPWPLVDSGWWCSETYCSKFASCKGLYMKADWKKVPK